MTPRKILAKYGLKTDVKSIRERMEGNLCLYLGIVDHFYPMLSHNTRERKADEIRTADLDLLCEMAEKVEKIGEVVETFEEWEKTVGSLVANAYAYSSFQEVVKILKGEKE